MSDIGWLCMAFIVLLIVENVVSGFVKVAAVRALKNCEPKEGE